MYVGEWSFSESSQVLTRWQIGNGLVTIMTTGAFIEDYRPATFVERGVAVPFTTPLLASARARPGYRLKVEFVVSNPSGGVGYYVMGWEGVLGLTKITVHDRLLYEAFKAAPMITPSSIRAAARSVAVGGAAGRPAAKAAKAQIQRENDDRLIANFLLTVKLLQQAGLGAIDWRSFNPTDRDLRVRTRALLERMEPVLGGNVETIFGWIDDLSEIVAPVGFPTRDYASRMQTILASLQGLQASMSTFGDTDATDAGQAAAFVAEVARVTAEMSVKTLNDCYGGLTDLVALLRNWSNNRERLLETFGRPDWLLDGWSTIAAIWEAACAGGRDAQRAAVLEIQRLVPVMPREAAEWADVAIQIEKAWNQRRWVRANVDWRNGSHLVDRTARNEMLRVMAA